MPLCNDHSWRLLGSAQQCSSQVSDSDWVLARVLARVPAQASGLEQAQELEAVALARQQAHGCQHSCGTPLLHSPYHHHVAVQRLVCCCSTGAMSVWQRSDHNNCHTRQDCPIRGRPCDQNSSRTHLERNCLLSTSATAACTRCSSLLQECGSTYDVARCGRPVAEDTSALDEKGHGAGSLHVCRLAGSHCSFPLVARVQAAIGSSRPVDQQLRCSNVGHKD
jgi:hypothetical protein